MRLGNSWGRREHQILFSEDIEHMIAHQTPESKIAGIQVHPKSVRQFFQETQGVGCIQVGVVVIPAKAGIHRLRACGFPLSRE